MLTSILLVILCSTIRLVDIPKLTPPPRPVIYLMEEWRIPEHTDVYPCPWMPKPEPKLYTMELPK